MQPVSGQQSSQGQRHACRVAPFRLLALFGTWAKKFRGSFFRRPPPALVGPASPALAFVRLWRRCVGRVPDEWHLDLKLPTVIVKMGYGHEDMGEILSGKASELGNVGDHLVYPS